MLAGRSEAVLEDRDEVTLVALLGLGDAVEVLQRQARRLLDEHGRAGVEGGDRRVGVGARRGADVDEVELLGGEHVLDGLVAVGDVVLLAELASRSWSTSMAATTSARPSCALIARRCELAMLPVPTSPTLIRSGMRQLLWGNAYQVT